MPDFNDPVELQKLKKNTGEVSIQEKYEKLEARMNKWEGFDDDILDVRNMGLVPDVVVPPKFKTPEFVKYNGT